MLSQTACYKEQTLESLRHFRFHAFLFLHRGRLEILI
jgi:hypothetical protein